MRGENGFTLAEFLVFFTALLIPVIFLYYHSPGITARTREYQCRHNLMKISRGLHVYAAQDAEHSFPKGFSGEQALRKIFTQGNLTSASVFDDPRISNGGASGTPGPYFLSPSPDLSGIDFLYAKEPLSLDSDSGKIIVVTKFSSTPSKFLALHVNGEISEETSVSSSDFF